MHNVHVHSYILIKGEPLPDCIYTMLCMCVHIMEHGIMPIRET